jgi:hypothetical protein
MRLEEDYAPETDRKYSWNNKNKPTESMEQSPSWEAKSSLPHKAKNSHFLLERNISLRDPATGPCI